MRILQFLALTTVLLAALAAQAQTRIYKSVDAEGNPVFTDDPTSGAQTVDIPATNSADAVSARPAPARPAAAPGRAQPAVDGELPELEPGLLVRDDEYHNGKEHRREERRDELGEERRREIVEKHIEQPRVEPAQPRTGARVGKRGAR